MGAIKHKGVNKMAVVLGIDVGGSTTKIVAYDQKIIGMLQVRAGDQITSLYGAIGNLLQTYHLKLNDVEKMVLTGVGASLIEEDIYGIPTVKVAEFEAVGKGALLLSGLDRALVVSMGTGTAYVDASKEKIEHIGGSGVGGGTLVGLSSKLLGVTDIDAIIALAAKGNLANVDLTIGDISAGQIPNLPRDITAANFGKVKSTATKEDFALGLMNMIYQTAGVLAGFCATGRGIKTVLFTGSVADLPQAKELLPPVSALYDLDFVIPPEATFATAIGAAIL